MSRRIETSWVCVECGHKNPANIIKPTLGTPTVIKMRCSECRSRLLIRFTWQRGHKVGFAMLTIELSAHAKDLQAEAAIEAAEREKENSPSDAPAGLNEGNSI